MPLRKDFHVKVSLVCILLVLCVALECAQEISIYGRLSYSTYLPKTNENLIRQTGGGRVSGRILFSIPIKTGSQTNQNTEKVNRDRRRTSTSSRNSRVQDQG